MGSKEVLEEFECVVVSRCSVFGIVFTYPQEVCVCERLVALSIEHRSLCVVAPLASVNV